LNRYRNISLELRFITEELGFTSDQDALEFLIKHIPESRITDIEEERKESALYLVDESRWFLQCKTAAPIFQEASRLATKRIDIKGQI
jgi:hypothetical protein